MFTIGSTINSHLICPKVMHARAWPLIRRKPSSAMECKWGNGDRAISPQRQSRGIPVAADAYRASLFPIDEKLSTELRHNSRITAKYLCPVGLAGGEQSIRTPETFQISQGEFDFGQILGGVWM